MPPTIRQATIVALSHRDFLLRNAGHGLCRKYTDGESWASFMTPLSGMEPRCMNYESSVCEAEAKDGRKEANGPTKIASQRSSKLIYKVGRYLDKQTRKARGRACLSNVSAQPTSCKGAWRVLLAVSWSCLAAVTHLRSLPWPRCARQCAPCTYVALGLCSMRREPILAAVPASAPVPSHL
jgi:hypothetical protein